MPVLTGLSATYLHRTAREYGPTCEPDSVRGEPTGHFVVLCGYNKETREVLVADPLETNPVSGGNRYVVSIDRVICAILLGILTYDANLLIIEPRKCANKEVMPVLIVVNNANEWPFHIPGVEVVDAKSYLTKPEYGEVRNAKVFNLCRSYRYQSLGYYVTLLATARGHKPLPNIMTIQDMKSQTVVRFVSDDLDDLIQDSLAPIESDKFTLSIYFGRNLARRYDRLSLHLFNLFQAPLLRAQFTRNGKWQLRQIGPVPVDGIPSQHRPFVVDVATEHFAGRRTAVRRRTSAEIRSGAAGKCRRAAAAFGREGHRTVRAGRRGLRPAYRLDRPRRLRPAGRVRRPVHSRDDGRQPSYLPFARRAAMEGLVVVDDPESILRCSNKVYLAELLSRHKIRIPRTVIVNKDNIDSIGQRAGLSLRARSSLTPHSRWAWSRSRARRCSTSAPRSFWTNPTC